MAEQDLVPKTRFEKQIPFPILASIAAEVKMSESQFPDDEIDFILQREAMREILYALDEGVETTQRQIKLLAELAAEVIRTIKLLSNQ